MTTERDVMDGLSAEGIDRAKDLLSAAIDVAEAEGDDCASQVTEARDLLDALLACARLRAWEKTDAEA